MQISLGSMKGERDWRYEINHLAAAKEAPKIQENEDPREEF